LGKEVEALGAIRTRKREVRTAPTSTAKRARREGKKKNEIISSLASAGGGVRVGGQGEGLSEESGRGRERIGQFIARPS